MATKQRRDIEVSLVAVQMPSMVSHKRSGHLLSVNLIWPRMGIAQRSAVKTIDLLQGECQAAPWSWCRRILFKETIEECFGISVTVSETLNTQQLARFARFFAGSALDLGEDIVEGAIPGVAGDLASIPLDYVSKQLLKNKDPIHWAKGDVDLNSQELNPDGAPQIISVSLLASCKRVKTTNKHQHSKGSAPAHPKQSIIVDKDAPDGFVQLAIRGLS